MENYKQEFIDFYGGKQCAKIWRLHIKERT